MVNTNVETHQRTKIDDRRKAKDKMLRAKFSMLIERAQTNTRTRRKEVNKSAKRHIKDFIENLVNEAEWAAAKGDMCTVYKITKLSCAIKEPVSLS